MQSSNPALSTNTFSGFGYAADEGNVMTMQGVVYKTALLLLLALLTAGWTWSLFFKSGNNPAAVNTWMMIGAIGGFVMALITVFKKEWAAITSVCYALLEGLFIGGLSAVLEASFPGIVIQAAGLTFGTLGAMLVAYQSGIIRATESFKLGVAAATGGIAVVYLVTIVLSLFGVKVPAIYGNGWVGIGFSLFVVAIAALNFVIDFDFIEQGTKNRVPKYMEWYAGFALMVTLIWLYIEFLRLLSKLRSR